MGLGGSRRVALVAMLGAVLVASAGGCDKGGVFFESMNPDSGRASGGEEVRIRGSGFKVLGNLEIRIGGKPATNVGIADDNTIVLTTPEAREPDQGHPLDVYLLTNQGRSYIFHNGFSYRRGAANTPNSELQRRL